MEFMGSRDTLCKVGMNIGVEDTLAYYSVRILWTVRRWHLDHHKLEAGNTASPTEICADDEVLDLMTLTPVS